MRARFKTPYFAAYFVLAAFSAFSSLPACASKPAAPTTATVDVVVAPQSSAAMSIQIGDAGPAGPPAYTQNAVSMYEHAEDAFTREDYDSAEASYRDLIARFAYSTKRRDAEIRIGDIAYRRNHFAEAARVYAQWLHDHLGVPEEQADSVRAKLTDARSRAEAR